MQRQIIYGSDQVGQVKVAAARQRLLELNPHIQVDVFNEQFCSQNAECISQDYTVLVDGTRHAGLGVVMKDLLFVLVTSGFFVIAWLYARSFEKL